MDDITQLREQVAKLRGGELARTCIHHTDAERIAITCPVCLRTELAQSQAEAQDLRADLRAMAKCFREEPDLLARLKAKDEALLECRKFMSDRTRASHDDYAVEIRRIDAALATEVKP